MAEQDQVFAKCAWRLIPFITLLYVMNYLDRTNVSFAALTMNKDLDFSPAVFGFGAGIVFLSYSLFAIPANAMLDRLGARRWISLILAVWGAISAANALIRDPASFYALRFLLGMAEAGFLPGMLLYLTYWFPQAYLARFTAMFMSAPLLSFAIGGPLASLILGMDGVAGLHGWQWLFLIEGMPTIVLAIAVSKFLSDSPAQASWLTQNEKNFIAARVVAPQSGKDRDLWRALRDPRVVVLGAVNFGILFSSYGIQLWLPQIVQAMGFSNTATGLIVALPFAVSVPVMILWGRSSDAKGERIWHVALPALFAAVSLVAASLAQNDLFQLLALSLAAIGVSSTFGPLFSLPSSFLRGRAAAGGIALFNTIGAMSGFVGASLIGLIREQTGGYAAAMAVLAGGLVLSAIIVLLLGRAMAPRSLVGRPAI